MVIIGNKEGEAGDVFDKQQGNSLLSSLNKIRIPYPLQCLAQRSIVLSRNINVPKLKQEIIFSKIHYCYLDNGDNKFSNFMKNFHLGNISAH
ncbi:hypothetical protein Glove_219g56 [Diversispora epigaea]|uniref:Uncharacterized protein n=1 Tax=Diversispora epigaea TaxID=1348612 RepID=A0A397IKP8_9GLOM|nr:hypothetical protein Glove_219g56 [Diversispora epigaea]